MATVESKAKVLRFGIAGLGVAAGQNREVPVPKTIRGREAELDGLYRAVVDDRPVFHDGQWGQATPEVILGIMRSARERREIFMEHQVPSPE